MNCNKCGKEGDGHKCDMCGAEAAEHDPNHECGGDHCMVKCSGCNEAEAKCACV
ncbi:MAG: hypothetical protein WD049_00045 [Candidatus Paceibacterota bacterium]